jgi:exosome complex RNA-binding protein Rrp42 (RNase PH superfamily)
VAWTLWLVAVALFVGLLVFSSDESLVGLLTLGWILALLAALVHSAVARRRGLQGIVDKTGEFVHLGVVPAFVRACREAYLVVDPDHEAA